MMGTLTDSERELLRVIVEGLVLLVNRELPEAYGHELLDRAVDAGVIIPPPGYRTSSV